MQSQHQPIVAVERRRDIVAEVIESAIAEVNEMAVRVSEIHDAYPNQSSDVHLALAYLERVGAISFDVCMIVHVDQDRVRALLAERLK